MLITTFILSLIFFAFCAGIVGALTGLGGAAFLTPILVLFFHVNIRYAIGAGLFAVMATSMGSAMAYFKKSYINLRIGIFLEVAAAMGAIMGAYVVRYLSTQVVQIIFGCFFVVIFFLSLRKKEDVFVLQSKDALGRYLKLHGSYQYNPQEKRAYHADKSFLGFLTMLIAGGFSGLLGIGSGTIKVLAMDQLMKLPYKVSTSTSNFIIGITAAVGAGIFFKQGYIEPIITSPIVIGTTFGALLGARCMSILPVTFLRRLFSFVILFLSIQMIYHGLKG